MVRRSSAQDVSEANNHQDELRTSNVAGLSSSKGHRRKSTYHHRYKTLKAKVKDVVSSAYSSTEVSPNSAAAGQFLSKTLPANAADGCEASMDSRQPNSSLRSEESSAFSVRAQDATDDTVDDEEDLTNPAEWRKFIDSVKKEVAGRPASVELDPGRDTSRVGAQILSQEENNEELRAGLRTPTAFRRLLAFNNRGDDEDYRRISRSRSPIKQSLSPTKFLRRSDASQSTNTSEERMDLATKSRFRLPRFPSPSRRSPYAQLGKFVRELPSQDSGEKKDCKVSPDFSGITSETPQEVAKVELPPPLPQSPEPPEMTSEPVNATPTKKVRKVKRKKSKSPPVAKPIPAEIQELNEQVLKAVGSAQHRLDDDDTTGDATRSNAGTNTQGDSIDQDDLLSNINISTTSGIQVKGDKQKEEMLHQMIARRVLSVLIRPTVQETGNDASSGPLPAKATNGAKSATNEVGSALDNDFTDAADDVQYHYAESTNVRGDDTAATTTAASQKSAAASTNTIREQLMALKAKTEHREQLKALKSKKEHVSLKKKFEKSRKTRGSGKKGRSDDNTNNKEVKSMMNKRSSSTRHGSNRREKASSYESFDDSFASKADAATCCFFGSLPLLCCCCADASKSGGDLVSEAEDEKTLYSDVSLDTYESGWGGGRPLPILSPSDFSAERDDLFDVIEKGICGAI